MDVDSSSPTEKNDTEEQKYNVKYLIGKMTNITPTIRPKIADVLRELCKLREIPNEVQPVFVHFWLFLRSLIYWERNTMK